MAEDAPDYLSCIPQCVSSLERSGLFFQHFQSKTHLLSYLFLCVVKMPFIPPVSIARSVSGLTGKESNSSASTAIKVCREDRGSVKERITLNLKQLGKKSHLPTAKGGLESKRKDSLTLRHSEIIPVSSSAAEPSPAQTCVKPGSEVKSRTRAQEEAHFTLTLTPEAVLLLQRRNSERHQRATKTSSSSAAGGGPDSRPSGRRRENPSKRPQTTQRRSASGNRVTPKISSEAELTDVRSILKISLLNERHKYDDVEYEEEDDYGVDERVVLKCTEWLRGLESPVAGTGLSKTSAKSC